MANKSEAGFPLYSVTYTGWSAHTLVVGGGGGSSATGVRNAARALDISSLEPASDNCELTTDDAIVSLFPTPWAHELALASGTSIARGIAHPPAERSLTQSPQPLPSSVRALALHSPPVGSDMLAAADSEGSIHLIAWPSLTLQSSARVSEGAITSLVTAPPALGIACATIDAPEDSDGCDIAVVALRNKATAPADNHYQDFSGENDERGSGEDRFISILRKISLRDCTVNTHTSRLPTNLVVRAQQAIERTSRGTIDAGNGAHERSSETTATEERCVRYCCVVSASTPSSASQTTLTPKATVTLAVGMIPKDGSWSSIARVTLPADKGGEVVWEGSQKAFNCALTSIAANSSKTRIACGSSEGDITVFKARDLAPLTTITGAHMLPVTALTFRPRTSRRDMQLASVSLDGTVRTTQIAPLERQRQAMRYALLGAIVAAVLSILQSLVSAFSSK